MPSSFAAQDHPHSVGLGTHSISPDYADHLDLEAVHSASVTADALDIAAKTLGAEPATAVDVGAGTGAGTIALARRFTTARVDSLDISSDLLGRLETSAASAGVADRVRTHRIDLDEDWTGVVPTGVDLVWASLSLHHLRDAAQVLRQAFTVLRPGGVIVVTEMTGNSHYQPGDLGSGREGLSKRLAAALAAKGYPVTADWSRELAEAGFDSVDRHDHTITVTGDTTHGAQYLMPQLRAWREHLAPELAPEDCSGLDQAIADLKSGGSKIVHSSGRAVWVAVRPTDTTVSTESDPNDAAGKPAELTRPEILEAAATVEAEVVIIGGGRELRSAHPVRSCN